MDAKRIVGFIRVTTAMFFGVIGGMAQSWQSQYWTFEPDGAEGYSELMYGAPDPLLIFGAQLAFWVCLGLMFLLLYRPGQGKHLVGIGISYLIFYAMVGNVNFDFYQMVIMCISMIIALIYTSATIWRLHLGPHHPQ